MNGWLFNHNGDPNDDVNGPFATNEDTSGVARAAIFAIVLIGLIGFLCHK